jgi:hypothetical protein
VSAWPVGLNSARAGRVKMLPAASRPSAAIPPLLERIFPPVPKLVSRLPLALNLATANEKVPPAGKLGLPWLPTQMIFPSGWRATPVPLSPPTKPLAASPPVPNVVSSFPAGRERATPKPPLTTMSLLGCRIASLGTPAPTPRSVSTFPPLPKVGSRLPGGAGRRGLRFDQDRAGAAHDGRRCGAHGGCRGAGGGGATGRRAACRSGGDTADGHGGKADAGDDSSWVSAYVTSGNVDYLGLLTRIVEAWCSGGQAGCSGGGPATGRPAAR